MSKFLLPIQIAIQMARKNKIRSGLTVFGTMIGIAMVIIVFSAGAGVKSIILDEISSFGDNWINVEIKIPSAGKTSQENATGLARGVSITTLTKEDAEAIEQLDNVTQMYAGITTQIVLAHKTEKRQPTVFGVTARYPQINKSDVAFGRFFSDEEDASAAQVIVLGVDAKEELFGNGDAVGESVSVDGRTYQVIGVMEELGATGFFNMDDLVYIPLKTVQKKIMGVDHILFTIAEIKDNSKAETTAEEIRWLLRDRHDITDPDKDDFAVTTMNEALSIVATIITAITWLLTGLAAISLLVGGVGIMNVMYVSVAERTFEIGLRKSVGATEQEIKWQFLIEAVVITLIGGVVGIIVGSLISFLVAVGAQFAGLAWTFEISLFSIILSTVFSIGVGVIFGVYPAQKAAALDPIVALRQE